MTSHDGNNGALLLLLSGTVAALLSKIMYQLEVCCSLQTRAATSAAVGVADATPTPTPIPTPTDCAASMLSPAEPWP